MTKIFLEIILKKYGILGSQGGEDISASLLGNNIMQTCTRPTSTFSKNHKDHLRIL
jgi:hypothetical protein